MVFQASEGRLRQTAVFVLRRRSGSSSGPTSKRRCVKDGAPCRDSEALGASGRLSRRSLSSSTRNPPSVAVSTREMKAAFYPASPRGV